MAWTFSCCSLCCSTFMKGLSHTTSFIRLLSLSTILLYHFAQINYFLPLSVKSCPLLSPPCLFSLHHISLSFPCCLSSRSCRAGLGITDFRGVCLPGLLTPSPEHPPHQPGEVCPGHLGCQWGGGRTLMTNTQYIVKSVIEYTHRKNANVISPFSHWTDIWY